MRNWPFANCMARLFLTNMIVKFCRNTNMLLWHKELWLIDHGASLYFHHSWQTGKEQIKDHSVCQHHVLLQWASELGLANKNLGNAENPGRCQLNSDEWLEGETNFETKEETVKLTHIFFRNAFGTF